MPSNTKLNLSQVSQFSSATVMFDGRGCAGEAELNQDTLLDMRVPDDCFLTGGILNVKGATWGDSCDLQVVDEDQVLVGRASPYGVNWDQIPGYPMLRQFVTDYFLVDSGQKQGTWDLPYAAKIYAGVYMRVVYHSRTATGPKPQVGMNYNLHKIIRDE